MPTTALLRKLIALSQGDIIPSSQLNASLRDAMMAEGILTAIPHGSRTSYRATSPEMLLSYIRDTWGISDLQQALKTAESDDPQRSLQVKTTGDSKAKRHRTMHGFLVNTLQPLETTLGQQSFTIFPPEGSFVYIYDYQRFRIPKETLVIGLENAENFRLLSRQAHLFPDRPTLFVARYPLSGDFPRWLASNENEYLHFGDFDLAGIHIFLSEIYSLVGPRASMLVPEDIEERLKHGSSKRYEAQYPQYGQMKVSDPRLERLVQLIHKYKKGYDQEGYIE